MILGLISPDVLADVHITEEGVALELLAVMTSLVVITVIMKRR